MWETSNWVFTESTNQTRRLIKEDGSICTLEKPHCGKEVCKACKQHASTAACRGWVMRVHAHVNRCVQTCWVYVCIYAQRSIPRGTFQSTQETWKHKITPWNTAWLSPATCFSAQGICHCDRAVESRLARRSWGLWRLKSSHVWNGVA